ncbi:hypothetical protein KIN20_001462 [Parelaphostrongylus tenuis]|uniref:Uncharacterized protein n=1 Tax=Parelaphostrongylus tenuis TaxID=148309 RepID=A0AAD5MF95_PARTN|nr:hypothetical protein KIN20_001462 [Parelaphostrongylus tenuis]
MNTVVLICAMLATVTVIFFGCCLVIRFMHRSLGSDEMKHTNTLPDENVVIHPKRVYEIQAEEGCFSSLPNIHETLVEQQKFTSNEELHFTEVTEVTEDAKCSPRRCLRRPETGDLKAIRHEHDCHEFRHMAKRKARKLHRDSTCAPLFKSATDAKDVLHR